jgi:glycosyltransferase involved in cell wall biosynthesis
MITAVIPCLNEDRFIGSVVRKTRQYVDHVLVTDGGSIDHTVYEAKIAGAKVHTDKVIGLGRNLRKGLNIALNGRSRPDIVVLLDGDGQHKPSDIPLLLAPIIDGRADVVLGNRTMVKGMPPYRLFGNGILSAFANFRSKVQLPDAMVGFWALKAEAVPNLTEPGWGVYIELLVKIRYNGFRLTSVPIQPIYHEELSDNSAEKPLKQGLKLLWAITKWRIICEVLHRGK